MRQRAGTWPGQERCDRACHQRYVSMPYLSLASSSESSHARGRRPHTGDCVACTVRLQRVMVETRATGDGGRFVVVRSSCCSSFYFVHGHDTPATADWTTEDDVQRPRAPQTAPFPVTRGVKGGNPDPKPVDRSLMSCLVAMVATCQAQVATRPVVGLVVALERSFRWIPL